MLATFKELEDAKEKLVIELQKHADNDPKVLGAKGINIVFHFGKALIELKKLQVKPPERGQISGQVPII